MAVAVRKDGWLRRAATWFASTFGIGTGGYAVLDPRRKTMVPRTVLRSESANELATMSLPQLRALCRKLERDNATARATVEGLVAQVVGHGIALEPDHGDDQVNERLRVVWQEYLRACDITGRRSIFDLQLQAFRDVVIAGEFLWRLAVLPERAKRLECPLVVVPLECEWLTSETFSPPEGGLTTVAGVELDVWGRPLAYRLLNPEAWAAAAVERVPAGEMIHGYERRRALQARGEPWLAPVVERIWQEGDLVDAELRAAINCAAMALVITSDVGAPVDITEDGTTDDPAQRLQIGSVARMLPGEKVEAFHHDRPSQQIDGFRRTLRGDIASAMRLDQVWLDKDYSKAGSYSSRRASSIDHERLHGPVREWFGHVTIGELYVRALPYLCLMAGVPLPKRAAYRLVPDGTPYIDPQKDAEAASTAINAGLSTYDEEIGKRGGDRRKVWQQLAIEKQEAAALGLSFDLSATNAPAANSQFGAEAEAANDTPKANQAAANGATDD